jgi:uncharacterized protein
LTWTQTYTGKKFDIFNPDPDAICIEDIAGGLGQINRFNGATMFPYSVAEHSLLVCDLCPDGFKLAGLLHDAAETYLGDWPGPWKDEVHIGCLDIHEVEAGIDRAICEAFKVPEVFQQIRSREVYNADQRALATERRDLMRSGLVWPSDGKYEPSPWPINLCEAWEAEQMFRTRFKELTA